MNPEPVSLPSAPDSVVVSLLDPDMPLEAWRDGDLPDDLGHTDWASELFAGVTTRDPPRVRRALTHLPILPFPPDSNDKLSLMSVRFFHPEIVIALRQAKLSYGAIEVANAIYVKDDPATFRWFLENMASVATALGFPGRKDGSVTDAFVSSLMFTPSAFHDLSNTWDRVHGRIAYLLLSKWFKQEVDGLLPASPSAKGETTPAQALRTKVIPANLSRWIARTLCAVAKHPGDPSIHTALQGFLDLPQAQKSTLQVFGRGSRLYDHLEPADVYNLQTYLKAHPAIASWVQASARRAANEFTFSLSADFERCLVHQLGWSSSKFGQKFAHAGNSSMAAYGDAQSNPLDSSFLDCLLLCPYSEVSSKFLRLPSASAAIRRRLSDDRAGFLMGFWAQEHTSTLASLDIFQDWKDNRGNTVAHYIFAQRACQGRFSKTAAIELSRRFAPLLLVANSLNITPLSLFPAEYASIVERTLLRKAARSVPKDKPASKEAQVRPSKRLM